MKARHRLSVLPFVVLSIGFTPVLRGESPTAEVNSTPPAAAAEADKSKYTLLNPTPASQMRDFVTDRPTVTEGPYTVDAGHVQVEMSFAEYTHDQTHGVKTDDFLVAPTNFRLGVLNNVDLQLIVNPYENVLVHGDAPSRRNAGFGDMTVRSTINLWGNDGDSKTAFGLLPFITLPTGTDGLSDHHVEGGLILPLDLKLPHGFDLSTEIECDVNYNPDEKDYGVDLVHTASLGHSLFSDKIGAYIEYVGVSPCGTGHTYLAYFDTGVTYLVRENVQLDVGINVGLSGRAEDFTVFSGLSFRL